MSTKISRMKYFSTFLLILTFTGIQAQNCDLTNYTIPRYFDTYHEYATQKSQWTMYNVHDPSVVKDGDYYYMYCTDVAWGTTTPAGLMKRRSSDLINWEYQGTAWDGCPPLALQWVHDHQPAGEAKYVCDGLWAPFIMEFNDEFRMYYSIPSFPAAIGLMTSISANGPWIDKGVLLGGRPSVLGINCIDPSVIIDQETGQHWMSYGSYEYGIYMKELDPATGLLKSPVTYEVRATYGTLIAARDGGRHKAIEGSELSYRNGWYYVIVSYDWLGDTYNLRVGRSKNPNGPYYDINGKRMSSYSDNYPMIVAPYKFNDHEGWQGIGHCGIYNDNGKYYIFNQARPTTSLASMVLHVREMHWIDDWPVLSPERYADFPRCTIANADIVGNWEDLKLAYNTSVPYNTSQTIHFDASGTINGDENNTWTFEKDTLVINMDNGQTIYKTIVQRCWDWENRSQSITYTGMNSTGLCIWGKKIDPAVVAKNTVLEAGASYIIRNHNSNLVIDVPNGLDNNGTSIRQYLDQDVDHQKWTLLDGGDGYFQLSPKSTKTGKVMAVEFNNANNGANVVLTTNSDLDAKKWKIGYLDNGYFGITSKISGNVRGLDVNNFSTSAGANILQWDYVGGNNQIWRFEKVLEDIHDGLGKKSLKKTNFRIYPNPSTGERLTIALSDVILGKHVSVSLFDANGKMVWQANTDSENKLVLDQKLSTGIYLIRLTSETIVETQKLVIY